MTVARRKYTRAEELSLLSQVDRVCPECGRSLFYKKNGKGSHKRYELAHIYPLNPTLEEIQILKDEEKLHLDANDPDNIIPLCVSCHTEFDKPRTVEDYQRMVAHKRACIRYSEQQEIQASYRIEGEISGVIDSLASELQSDGEILQYDPKSLDQKMKGSMPLPLIRKIKHNVADYYPQIKSKFVEIESESPNASVLIYAQIRAFYLHQAKLGVPQQEVFKNMVDWIGLKAKPASIEAAEIVVSFFVQNCEVFE